MSSTSVPWLTLNGTSMGGLISCGVGTSLHRRRCSTFQPRSLPLSLSLMPPGPKVLGLLSLSLGFGMDAQGPPTRAHSHTNTPTH